MIEDISAYCYILNMKYNSRSSKKVNKDLVLKKRKFKFYIFIGIATIAVIFFTAILIPYESKVEYDEAFIPDQIEKNDNSLELGEEKIVQEARVGKKHISYKVKAPLVLRWFNPKEKLDTYDYNSEILDVGSSKVIVKGSLKYQYMNCSDGSSRYYTDEQFKDPKVGFTSKSEDFCQKNEQGKKVGISNSPNYTPNQIVAKQPVKPPYSDPSCKKINIVPFKTVNRQSEFLPRGESKVVMLGYDGYDFECPSLPPNQRSFHVDPMDQVVDIGIGKTAAEITEEQRQADEIKRLQNTTKAEADYNYRLQQCIKSVMAQSHGQMSKQHAHSFCATTVQM